jgi:hypothetical protein
MTAAMHRLKLPCPRMPTSVEARFWQMVEGSSVPLSPRAGYALTHAIFFLSDFGRKPHRIRAARRHWMANGLPGWLRQQRQERDPDLFAELVFAAACLGLPCPTPRPWAWLRRTHRAAVSGSAGFARAYHPAITAMLASLACDHTSGA